MSTNHKFIYQSEDAVARETVEAIEDCIEAEPGAYDFDFSGAMAIVKSALRRYREQPGDPNFIEEEILKHDK